MSAASGPARALGAADVDTLLSSPQSRRRMTVDRCTPAFRSCAGSALVKPNAYAPESRPEPPSSVTAANGFAASPSNRVSSTSVTSRAPVALLRVTLPSAGRTQCLPTSRTASWRLTGRRQASAALPRRLRLALQPPFCPENDPRAPRHRGNDDPADALPTPQTG